MPQQRPTPPRQLSTMALIGIMVLLVWVVSMTVGNLQHSLPTTAAARLRQGLLGAALLLGAAALARWGQQPSNMIELDDGGLRFVDDGGTVQRVPWSAITALVDQPIRRRLLVHHRAAPRPLYLSYDRHDCLTLTRQLYEAAPALQPVVARGAFRCNRGLLAVLAIFSAGLLTMAATSHGEQSDRLVGGLVGLGCVVIALQTPHTLIVGAAELAERRLCGPRRTALAAISGCRLEYGVAARRGSVAQRMVVVVIDQPGRPPRQLGVTGAHAAALAVALGRALAVRG